MGKILSFIESFSNLHVKVIFVFYYKCELICFNCPIFVLFFLQYSPAVCTKLKPLGLSYAKKICFKNFTTSSCEYFFFIICNK